MKIEDETASLTDDKYLRDDFVLCSYKISCSIEKSKAKQMKKKTNEMKAKKKDSSSVDEVCGGWRKGEEGRLKIKMNLNPILSNQLYLQQASSFRC